MNYVKKEINSGFLAKNAVNKTAKQSSKEGENNCAGENNIYFAPVFFRQKMRNL